MTGSERFGANLREWRQRRKLTQTQLGALVDADGPRISKMESGGENPTLETIDRLADALAINSSHLHLPRPEEDVEGDEPKGVGRLETVRLRELEAEAPAEDTARGDIYRAQHALATAQDAVAKASAALNRALRRTDTESGAA